MWFIGVEVEQETSAPPPKKNPGSAPEYVTCVRASEQVGYVNRSWLVGDSGDMTTTSCLHSVAI